MQIGDDGANDNIDNDEDKAEEEKKDDSNGPDIARIRSPAEQKLIERNLDAGNFNISEPSDDSDDSSSLFENSDKDEMEENKEDDKKKVDMLSDESSDHHKNREDEKMENEPEEDVKMQEQPEEDVKMKEQPEEVKAKRKPKSHKSGSSDSSEGEDSEDIYDEDSEIDKLVDEQDRQAEDASIKFRNDIEMIMNPENEINKDIEHNLNSLSNKSKNILDYFLEKIDTFKKRVKNNKKLKNSIKEVEMEIYSYLTAFEGTPVFAKAKNYKTILHVLNREDLTKYRDQVLKAHENIERQEKKAKDNIEKNIEKRKKLQEEVKETENKVDTLREASSGFWKEIADISKGNLSNLEVNKKYYGEDEKENHNNIKTVSLFEFTSFFMYKIH